MVDILPIFGVGQKPNVNHSGGGKNIIKAKEHVM